MSIPSIPLDIALILTPSQERTVLPSKLSAGTSETRGPGGADLTKKHFWLGFAPCFCGKDAQTENSLLIYYHFFVDSCLRDSYSLAASFLLNLCNCLSYYLFTCIYISTTYLLSDPSIPTCILLCIHPSIIYLHFYLTLYLYLRRSTNIFACLYSHFYLNPFGWHSDFLRMYQVHKPRPTPP